MADVSSLTLETLLESLPKSIPIIYLSNDSQDLDQYISILKGISWERGIIGVSLPLRAVLSAGDLEGSETQSVLELF